MEHYHNTEETSKYNDALALYPTPLTDEQAKTRTATIMEKYVAENNTPEVKKLLFNCIDLTTLKTEDSEESVLKFTERVNELDNEHPEPVARSRVGECGMRIGWIPLITDLHRGESCRDSPCLGRWCYRD